MTVTHLRDCYTVQQDRIPTNLMFLNGKCRRIEVQFIIEFLVENKATENPFPGNPRKWIIRSTNPRKWIIF